MTRTQRACASTYGFWTRRQGAAHRLDEPFGRICVELDSDTSGRAQCRSREVDVERVLVHCVDGMVVVDGRVGEAEPPVPALTAASDCDVLGEVGAHGRLRPPGRCGGR